MSHFHSRKWFGESDCGGRDGPLSQLLAQDVCPGKRERGETRADLPVVNLTVSAAGATVPHVDKTKEGIRAVMQREWGHGGEDAYFFKSSKIEGEKNLVAFGAPTAGTCGGGRYDAGVQPAFDGPRLGGILGLHRGEEREQRAQI